MKNYLRSFPIALVLCGLPGLVHAAGVVTEPTESNLRTALAGGGAVTFACDGVIALASTLVITNDTSFDASGRSVTLSGNNAVRVLQVNSGVQLTLNNLTVANGRTSRGAGIFNDGGAVTLTNCILANNRAVGTNGLDVTIGNPPYGDYRPGESAYGGAVWNDGSFVATGTAFLTNSATGGNGGMDQVSASHYEGDGGDAAGGAIHSSGNVMLADCAFRSNSVLGGNGGSGYLGGSGGEAKGGAILSAGGPFGASRCVFEGNNASAGFNGRVKYGYRGNAFGGGICSTGALQLITAYFSTNMAVGANAGGGGVFHAAGVLTLELSQFIGNKTQGDMKGVPWETAGGFARGGAVFNGGEAKIVDTTISSNGVTGGNGTTYEGLGEPDGGDGSGGGVFNSGKLTLSRCTLDANCSQGGNGAFPGGTPWYGYGTGGRGAGGGCASAGGQLHVANSTLSGNSTLGGQGGSPLDWDIRTPTAGSGGDGVGGAVYSTNSLLGVTNSTIVANLATGGTGGAWKYDNGSSGNGPTGQALTGGIRFDGGGAFSLYNSIVAQNNAGDVFGTFDGTPNLIGGDPRLSSLADNGGPTRTMALLPDSPAIDRATNLPEITTDQRGVTRPFGSASDLGAYEWNATSFYSSFHLGSLSPTGGQWHVKVAGPTNRSFRLCVSSNLADWLDLRTNTTDDGGVIECLDDSTADWPVRFYRVVSP